MAVSTAGWLFALHAAPLQIEAGTAEATGLKIPSRSSSRPLHWEDEADQFTRERRPNPSAPPSPPKPNLFTGLCPTSLRASISPFLAFTGEDYKPNRIWSVAPGGVCGPRLLNKGADWLIDRPSAVPAPHVSWFAALYMNPLLVWPALALVKCGVWWMAPIFPQNPDEPPKHLSSSSGFSPGKPHEHRGTGVL